MIPHMQSASILFPKITDTQEPYLEFMKPWQPLFAEEVGDEAESTGSWHLLQGLVRFDHLRRRSEKRLCRELRKAPGQQGCSTGQLERLRHLGFRWPRSFNSLKKIAKFFSSIILTAFYLPWEHMQARGHAPCTAHYQYPHPRGVISSPRWPIRARVFPSLASRSLSSHGAALPAINWRGRTSYFLIGRAAWIGQSFNCYLDSGFFLSLG